MDDRSVFHPCTDTGDVIGCSVRKIERKRYPLTNLMVQFGFFVLYSFLGWVSETIFCSIPAKKFINRGFLNGPFCPIYGTGAVLVINLFSKYADDLLALFILSMVVTSAVEYVTSYLLEKIFHLSLWDYSKRPFNLNGRVCLRNSVLFGIMSVLMVKVIHPGVERVLSKMPVWALITFTVVLVAYFLSDLFITARALVQINKAAGDRQLELEGLAELRNEVMEKIEQDKQEKRERIRAKISHRRVFQAFPNLQSKRYPEALEELKEDIEEWINTKKREKKEKKEKK